MNPVRREEEESERGRERLEGVGGEGEEKKDKEAQERGCSLYGTNKPLSHLNFVAEARKIGSFAFGSHPRRLSVRKSSQRAERVV